MATPLKPLSEQVVVLTGATSGIGLVTARLLAPRVAGLVIVARNRDALDALHAELGGTVLPVAADVGAPDEVAHVATQAVAQFGRIDAWVNNAGVAIYGAVEDVPWDDHRRLFETNYWGVVTGCLEALKQFEKQAAPGKIVTVGSVLSDRAMIYQGPYSASKHAVKGFVAALRAELEAAGRPVSLTLIKPGPIDTPYMEHARSFMSNPSDPARPNGTRNPPPSYDPALVADAIAYALTHDVRDLNVGGAGWLFAKLGQLAPRLTDIAVEIVGHATQTSSGTPRPGMRDNLYRPARDLEERSAMPGPRARRSSLLLAAEKRPAAMLLAGTLLGAGLIAVAKRRR